MGALIHTLIRCGGLTLGLITTLRRPDTWADHNVIEAMSDVLQPDSVISITHGPPLHICSFGSVHSTQLYYVPGHLDGIVQCKTRSDDAAPIT
eukprot:7212609-Karenia_brevis.AAC.1